MDHKAFVYIDGVIVLGETFEEHLDNLREVFKRLREAKLQLNPDKCQFGRKELKYLGHTVTAGDIRTDPDKVSAIRNLPAPTNVKDLRRILGIAFWYRRFVPSYAKTVAPLTSLLRKGNRWSWGEPQEVAFGELKRLLTEAPVLGY